MPRLAESCTNKYPTALLGYTLYVQIILGKSLARLHSRMSGRLYTRMQRFRALPRSSTYSQSAERFSTALQPEHLEKGPARHRSLALRLRPLRTCLRQSLGHTIWNVDSNAFANGSASYTNHLSLPVGKRMMTSRFSFPCLRFCRSNLPKSTRQDV